MVRRQNNMLVQVPDIIGRRIRLDNDSYTIVGKE
jgi:hypothetical protein